MEPWYFDVAEHSCECFCADCQSVAAVYAAEALDEGLCRSCWQQQQQCVCDVELHGEIDVACSARSLREHV